MSLVVSDNFAGPSGRSRITTSGQVGACYLPLQWAASSAPTLSGDGYLLPNGTGPSSCAVLASGASASTNEVITGTIRMTGAATYGNATNVMARCPGNSNIATGYFLSWGSLLLIEKWTGGQTNLTSAITLPSTADVYTYVWTLAGAAQTVQVQRASDGKYLTSGGSWQTGAVICLSCTDSTYASGSTGIWYYVGSQPATTQIGAYTVTDDGTATTPTPTANIVWHGDSLTYGQNGSNAGTLLATRLGAVVSGVGSNATYSVYGNPGHTLEQIISELPTVVALMDPTKRNVLVAQGGHNSFDAGDTAAQVEGLIQTYVAAAHAQAYNASCGLTVVWDTELPAAYPGYPSNFDQLRDASNTWLRANYGSAGIAVLSDVASNATIGQDGDEQNASYYSGSDHTHLTDAGYAIWGGYDLPAVRAAVVMPLVAPVATPTATGATLAANLTGGVGTVTYAWSGTGITFSNAAVANPTATVALPGTYTATLAVTDSIGDTATASTTFAVGPAVIHASPPTLSAGLPQTLTISGTLLSTLTFNGSAGASVVSRFGMPPGQITLTVQAPSAGGLTVTDASGVSASVTFVAAQPAPPVVTSASGSATATWAASPGAATYKLYRTPAGGTASVVYSGSLLAYADTGLANGTAYTYAVSAVDAGSHESAQSGGVTVTPAVVDYFAGTTTGLAGPFTRDFAVTTSDTVDLPFVTAAISVTASGTVKVQLAGATSPVVLSAAPGELLPVRATRVYATGTTATGIVALS
jgi:lysophospholipase L1-like esterase